MKKTLFFWMYVLFQYPCEIYDTYRMCEYVYTWINEWFISNVNEIRADFLAWTHVGAQI